MIKERVGVSVNTEWLSPVVVSHRKDEKRRSFVDYGSLIAMVFSDNCHISCKDECDDPLAKATIFTILDAYYG